MREKTILFTIDMFHIGGITSFIQQYSKVLTQNNYSVVILGLKGDLDCPEAYFPNCTLYFIPSRFNNAWFKKIFKIPVYVYYLNKIFSEHTIVCIHTSTLWSTLYVLLHPKSLFIPIISTFYGAHYLEKKSVMIQPNRSRFTTEFRRYVQGSQYMVIKKIIVFNEYSKKLVLHSFPWISESKVTIIPGLISKECISHSHPRYSLAKDKNKKSTLRIFSVFRAEPRKGAKVLLEAASILKQKGLDFKLTVVSPVSFFEDYGIYHTFEELQLSSHVHLAHAMDQRQLKNVMDNSDLYVMPSQQYETFGMTLLESLAAGVPSIGTPLESLSEILSYIDRRLLTDSITAEDIAKKILWFSTLSYAEKLKLSKNSIACVDKKYRLEKYAASILRIYNEFI